EKASLISLDGYFALAICNKLEILGLAYIADYLTRKEFRKYSIRVCKLIQKEFYNWDDLVKSYIVGDREWSDSLERFTDRTGNYIMLKEEKLAYQVDWNLNLE
ncbi:MAG: DUF1266 domain-containing protein, partial [Eubacteriales bacterium]|nr:DUF1266 domain-containing protein [Eubacteriales bacterium]